MESRVHAREKLMKTGGRKVENNVIAVPISVIFLFSLIGFEIDTRKSLRV